MIQLKYGCNPQQAQASLEFIGAAPFEVLNGRLGYINTLDAINAWQLVSELKKSLGLTAAASFKHVSPAGAAVAVPMSDSLRQVYGFTEGELSDGACAYLRARGADPSSSFGDFIALSDEVDVLTAQILAKVVSDGIIAPSYEPEALEILKNKKKGAFIVLQADENFVPPQIENREIFGLRLSQSRSEVLIDESHIKKIVSRNKDLSEGAVRDMILGLISIKYTQSNSVGYALDGQMIGIGAGQQSRVDCTKLAGRKVDNWFLRQHEKITHLKFNEGVKRQDIINWKLRLVEGDLTESERRRLKELLPSAIPELTETEKREWLSQLKDVSYVSDAFVPFRDNVDHAVRHGVRYMAHTGGSLRDDLVTEAADEYDVVMVHTGVRLFHH